MKLLRLSSAVIAAVAAFVLSPAFVSAQDAPYAEPEEENDSDTDEENAAAVAAAERLLEVVKSIDENAQFGPNGAVFEAGGATVTLIYDVNADRMRLVAPVASADGLAPEELMRLMQANFDSALDARYAVAQGVVWSVFLHPLSTLGGEEFGSGLGQTINLVATYGSTYSSGAFIFGGGDSMERQRELIEELKEKGRDV